MGFPTFRATDNPKFNWISIDSSGQALCLQRPDAFLQGIELPVRFKSARNSLGYSEKMDTTMNAADKPALKPANDNPWYWLATLYGEWTEGLVLDQDIAQKNRIAWNRWFAKALSAEQRDKLLKNGFSSEELVPWMPTEEAELAVAFIARSGRMDQSLPAPVLPPDFSHTVFNSAVSFVGFHFPYGANFSSAIFFGEANFYSATFSEECRFNSATFSRLAYFNSVKFSEMPFFKSATFSGEADFESAAFSWGASFKSATFFPPVSA